MKFYAVAKGREVGVFTDWTTCEKQVKGFGGALFKSFTTKQAAEQWIQQNDGSNKKRKDMEEEEEKDPVTLHILTCDDQEYILDAENMKKATLNNEYLDLNSGLMRIYFDKNSGHVGKNGYTLIQWNNQIIKEITPKEKQAKKKTKQNYIEVYADGGCLSNGSENAKAGVGVYFEGGEYGNVSKRINGKQTNNRAELTAILVTLRTIKPEENVRIYTDSAYSIAGINKTNKRNVNLDIFEQLDRAIAKRTGTLELIKVEGHSGLDDGNSCADALATSACKTEDFLPEII